MPPPRFEVADNGIIHIFWQDEDNNLFYAQTPQANLGSPASWSSQAKLGVTVADYDVVLDAMDGLHVSFMTNEDPWINRLVFTTVGHFNGGSSWTGALGLFLSPYFVPLPLKMHMFELLRQIFLM